VAGDVLLDHALRRTAARTGDPAEAYAAMLAPVARRWRRDGERALVLVNLESPVARLRRGPHHFLARSAEIRAATGHARIPSPLNAPPTLLDGLARAGVHAVDLANNHALDQGRDGLAETLQAAATAGPRTLGAGLTRADAHAPLRIGPAGARLGVLATFLRDHDEPASLPDGVARLAVTTVASTRAMEDAVRSLAADVAGVVVVVHVVAELEARPRPAHRALAARLGAAGADVILFHGPHVPGPIERITLDGREVTVAYSLGNLLSDTSRKASARTRGAEPAARGDKWADPRTRAGLLARVTLRVALAGEAPRVDVRFVPTWAHSDRELVADGLRAPPLTFTVEPLAACGPPLDLRPSWPAAAAARQQAFVARHRDALLTVTGLAPPETPPPAGMPLPRGGSETTRPEALPEDLPHGAAPDASSDEDAATPHPACLQPLRAHVPSSTN
jgi:poly-gamma-glutamate synthesis protein (capsule biosynthesis protein)